MAEQITVTPARSGGAIASAPDEFRFRRGGRDSRRLLSLHIASDGRKQHYKPANTGCRRRQQPGIGQPPDSQRTADTATDSRGPYH